MLLFGANFLENSFISEFFSLLTALCIVYYHIADIVKDFILNLDKNNACVIFLPVLIAITR